MTSGGGGGEASLRREIGVALGIAIAVNATIGTGIFKTPARVAELAGTLPLALSVWVLGALVALAGALSVAELAAFLPRSGGLYEPLRLAYGSRVAFVFGWAKLVLLIPSAAGSFARLGAEALGSLLGLAANPRRDAAVALSLLAACAGANVIGVRASARAQALVTAVKYAGVLLLALLGLFAPLRAEAPGDAVVAAAVAVSPTVLGFLAATVSAMWAYDGWADLSYMAGEAKDPGRTLPRALIAGALLVAAVYLLANAGYARTLGLAGLRASTTGGEIAAARVAVRTLGSHGRALLSLLVFVSCTGGCLASLMTGSRTFVPMATDGLFVRSVGVVSERTGVPTRAVVLSASLGALYVLSRSFEQLTEGFVVGYLPFYMLAVLSVFVLRRKEPARHRPFRVPGYPFVPGFFLVASTALLVGALLRVDRTALFALLVLAMGFPIGEVWARRARG